MKFLRIVCTIVFMMLLFDALAAFALWQYGWPKETTPIRSESGSQFLLAPMMLSTHDWIKLIVFFMIQISLAYFVLKLWKSKQAKS